MQQPNNPAGTGALSVETCKSLAAAGYPQSAAARFWVIDPALEAAPYIGPPHPCASQVACPNVGELLAELQRRWPKRELRLTYSPEMEGWQAWHWRCPETFDAGLRDTSEAAVAALYLRLVEVEHG